MPRLLSIDEYGFGLTWTLDEAMQRASHALVHDGKVWLIDPVDLPEAIDAATKLGEIAGVIQLLDRHNRDGKKLAERFGVPLHRLPDALPADAPFERFDVVQIPKWREVGLWWPEQKALVVPEAVGTGPMFRPSDTGTAAGVHLFLRLRPPSPPRRYTPEHLLVGHGPAIHGPAAADALHAAYARSLKDFPRVLARLPFALKG